MIAVISSGRYRYGSFRAGRAGSSRDGGTWVSGSLACSQDANPRTADSRWAW